MARAFDGIDDYIDCGNVTGLNSVAAFTLTFWGQRSASNKRVQVAKHVDGSNRVNLLAHDDGVLYLLMCNGGSQFGTVSETSTAMLHRAMVFDGSGIDNATRLKGYVSGVAQTLSFTGTIQATTANLAAANLTIGISTDEGVATGNIAEVALWSAALSDAEIASLAKGFSPLFIRPESLIDYWPLIGRFSPEIDVVGGMNGTLNSAPGAAAHPGILYPASPFIPEPSAGTVGAGLIESFLLARRRLVA